MNIIYFSITLNVKVHNAVINVDNLSVEDKSLQTICITFDNIVKQCKKKLS